MKPLYSVWPDNWKEPNPGSISALRYPPSRSLTKSGKPVKKKIAIGLSVVILLVIMAGALFWNWTGLPLYKPGMVSSAEGSNYTLTPTAPSEEASRMYADLFPNAEFQIIKNTSHFPFSENPEAFSEIVGNFLQDLN